jgi:delta 1-pyrroline-5-carboxylate dehydrogenase
MKVRKDETFGPLLPIVPFETVSEAVEIANSTEYGLSGAVFTNDMDEGREIAGRIKTGSVNINDVLITYAFPSLPFGGVKHSGVGTYHAETGLRAFTNTKSITEFKWKLKREIFWYPLPEGSDKVASAAITAYFSSNLFRRMAALARAVIQIWKIRKN